MNICSNCQDLASLPNCYQNKLDTPPQCRATIKTCLKGRRREKKIVKLTEIQPNVEYAQFAGKYYRNKIRFTSEDLAQGPSKRYGEKGQVRAQVWRMGWDREWNWKSESVPLSQIKMTWTEYEAERAEYLKLRAEQDERNRIASEKRERDTELLREFLRDNMDELMELFGTSRLYTFSPVLQVELNLEKLTRLLERVK